MVKVKRSTWELQDRSVDNSCCLLSLRINLITSGLQLILSKSLSLLIPIKKVARNLVYGRLPSWREEKEWGEVIPQYVAHTGAVQTLMLKNKDVESKEGEEQSCIHSSQEEKLIWNLKSLNRNSTGQRVENSLCDWFGGLLSFPSLESTPPFTFFSFFFFKQVHYSPCLC